MSEHKILLFMIQVLAVLGLARILGEISRWLKQPPLAGEILAGILLGQTVLGQLAPGVFASLFPPDELQHAMFSVTAEIGILFLLLVVGLEVNIASAWKMRHQTFTVALTGVVIPLGLGTAVAWLMYDSWVEVPAPKLAFSLLVGAGVAITAITVVARLLFDMRIIKSDLGLFLVSAMALNELLGWVVLAIVLGLVGAGAAGEGADAASLIGTLAGILVFAAFATTLGRWLTTHALLWIERKNLPTPAAPLSLVVCLGLVGGIVTGTLGVHPVFGFLLAGMMAGDRRALSEHTRSIMAQMVEAIFVPLFFAGICLHVDFASHFDIETVLLVCLLSVGGKFLGAWFGTLLVRMDAAERIPIALAHIPGGPMGVLLASVAKEAGVIGPKMFVALVVASIVSALIVGPAFSWTLRRAKTANVLRYFSHHRIVCGLEPNTREEAIEELAKRASAVRGAPDAAMIRDAVVAREATMGTGVGEGIAIPHARLDGLKEPLVVIGISKQGIPWDSIDGKPAQLIFLVLTPSDASQVQLEILSAIAKAFSEPQGQRSLIDATSPHLAWEDVRLRLSAAEFSRPEKTQS